MNQRTVGLVLVASDGHVFGALPPIPVATPWWQDIAPVVRAAREHFGIEIVVLRLLGNERAQPPGGEVTYLAEVAAPPARELVSAGSWLGALDDHPLRHAYARPGGPAADLAWARSVLDQHGMQLVAAPEQVRTWNLSSVWRLPVVGQHVWLKVVPPFMTREGALISLLGGPSVPTVLGHDAGRCLLAEVPGMDLYESGLPQLLDMVTLLVGLQARWTGRLASLSIAAVSDWRSGPLTEAIADVLERTSDQLAPEDAALLANFVDGLPQRFEELAGCGIPDTLVHGDFHPGNFRGDGSHLTLLDWGEGGIGHPLLDQSAFLERVPRASLDVVLDHWAQSWSAVVPDADPRRAARLVAPIAEARRATIYQRFLDHIEPTEHPYHRTDPADWLRHTAALLRRTQDPD